MGASILATNNIQKVIQKELKKKSEAEKKFAKKQAEKEARRIQASSIVTSQPVYGNVKILDKTAEELVNILSNSYKREDFTIRSSDVKLPVYLEKNLTLEFEKLKQYGLISDYYYWITGMWEISIFPSLLTYMDDKERVCMGTNSNVNNFYGNLNGVQIQQGTVNSIQNQIFDQKMDYEAIMDVINQIKKYDMLLDSELKENASEIRGKVDELTDLVEKRENPSKIKTLLEDVKNLALGVTGSLIASGIVAIVTEVL